MRIGKRLPRIEVKQKTGFRNITGNPIVLLDQRGMIFYDTRDLQKRVWEFNLPEGIYYIHMGKFSQIEKPVNFPLIPLPKPEREFKVDPTKFKLSFGDNPYTGTIDWDKKTIMLDNELKTHPMPDIVFVFYHELGHQYYTTEEFCDAYASNCMIEAGYNPSQIGEGIIYTLSQNQLHRKQYIINRITQATT